MNPNSSYLLDLRNLQEQIKKALLFSHFTVRIICSSDLKSFANSRPSAMNFKSFSWSLEQFFLTVSQNNFSNKIPFFWSLGWLWVWFFSNLFYFQNTTTQQYLLTLTSISAHSPFVAHHIHQVLGLCKLYNYNFHFTAAR